MAKLSERKEQLERIKSDVEEVVTAVLADVKAAGTEIESVEEIGDILIEAVDDVTFSGLAEPFDGPVAKSILKKLLKTKAGVKIEAWYQALRKKVIG
jgi:hypothetical protein